MKIQTRTYGIWIFGFSDYERILFQSSDTCDITNSTNSTFDICLCIEWGATSRFKLFSDYLSVFELNI